MGEGTANFAAKGTATGPGRDKVRGHRRGAVVETVVTIDRGLLEGPVWRPESGDLLITGVMIGRVLRIDVGAGTASEFARPEGGPNGGWPCADGGMLVTQNGGLDWDRIGFPAPPDPSAPTTPGIQRVAPDGTVSLRTGDDGPFRAPNDLFVTVDGTIWFTDPPRYPPPPEPVGRGLAVAARSPAARGG